MHKNDHKKKTRILVTGGSGFIGTNLVQHYLERQCDVLNLDITPPRYAKHLGNWQSLDIRDREALVNAVQAFEPEVVLHMAARTDLRGTSAADYTTNTEGVSNLIAALQKIPKVKLAVFASSMLVCRIGYSPKSDEDYAPSTAYGESKVDGELRVRREATDRLPWVIIRPTSIWGPWFSTPYRDFFDAVRRGRYFHPSGHNIYRNYGFVLNAVQQIDALVATSAAGIKYSTLYLADYEAVDLKEWALTIQDEFRAPTVRDVPLFALRLAAKLGDSLQKIGIAFPLTSFRLNNLLTDSILDTRPLQNVLGALPYDLKAAVALTCQWMKSSEGRS